VGVDERHDGRRPTRRDDVVRSGHHARRGDGGEGWYRVAARATGAAEVRPRRQGRRQGERQGHAGHGHGAGAGQRGVEGKEVREMTHAVGDGVLAGT